MKNLLLTFLCLMLSYAPAAWSGARQNHADIRKVAMDFLQAQTQNMPGKTTLKVDDIDHRLDLPACPRLEAFLPAGATLLGKTSIGIRCNEKNGWSLFITATVTTTINMLVSSAPLQQGHVIGADDFSIQSGELHQAGIITDESQILGKILKYSIGAGQLLKQDMFRAPYAVTQGQTVQLLSEGRGFKLRSEGQALNNAAEGQAVQVKVPSGQVISGKAKGNGTVEVRP